MAPSEDLFFDGDSYFEALLASIAAARHSVHFETYIFENGPLGTRMITALIAAAQRGVRVRLLIDGIGSLDFPSGAALLAGGVNFHYYHPISRFLDRIVVLGLFTPLSRMRPFKHFFDRLNHRNHRKMCIIDGLEIWIGSFNVVSRNLSSIYGSKAWRDTGVRLRGVDPMPFALAFRVTWFDHLSLALKRASQKKLLRALSTGIAQSHLRTNTSRKLRQLFFDDLISRIRGARTRVWITTPYFVPPRPLLDALLFAASQGTDVILLLPGPTDIPVVSWVSSLLYPTLTQAGVRVFKYQPSILHAKCLLIDDWARLGSSNFDFRSSIHDIEANYATTLPSTLKALEVQFAVDLGNSLRIDPASPGYRGRLRPLKRLIASLFVSFRYWM